MTKASLSKCEGCRRTKVTADITFKANVSALVRRWESTFSANLCFVCMSAKFLSFELQTLLGTWWGMIGIVLGPLFLFHNVVEYTAGSFAIAKASRGLKAHRALGDQSKEPSRIEQLTVSRRNGVESSRPSELEIFVPLDGLMMLNTGILHLSVSQLEEMNLTSEDQRLMLSAVLEGLKPYLQTRQLPAHISVTATATTWSNIMTLLVFWRPKDGMQAALLDALKTLISSKLRANADQV